MFERYYTVGGGIRLERGWWKLVKYGIAVPLLGIVPTVIVLWLWIL